MSKSRLSRRQQDGDRETRSMSGMDACDAPLSTSRDTVQLD